MRIVKHVNLVQEDHFNNSARDYAIERMLIDLSFFKKDM